jgi:hypothetical protein
MQAHSTPRRASSPGEHIPIVRVARARKANRPSAFLSHPPLFCPQGEWPRLPFTACIGRYVCSLQACSFSLQGWRLTDLPLRASNEGSPRPRVARAQKIIRLHPFLCSASKKGTWPLPTFQSFRYPPLRPQGEQPDCPSLRALREHILIVRPQRARRMIWLLPSHSSFDRATLSWL